MNDTVIGSIETSVYSDSHIAAGVISAGMTVVGALLLSMHTHFLEYRLELIDIRDR